MGKAEMKVLAQQSAKVRSSGVKSSVDLSPHKEEIEEWMVKYRWSPNNVTKELKRLYPEESHPSKAAIERYRNERMPDGVNILSNQFSTGISRFETVNRQIEAILKRYHPVLSIMKISQKTMDAIDSLTEGLNRDLQDPQISQVVKQEMIKAWLFLCEQAIKIYQLDVLLTEKYDVYGQKTGNERSDQSVEGHSSADEILARAVRITSTIAQYLPGGDRERFDLNKIRGNVIKYDSEGNRTEED